LVARPRSHPAYWIAFILLLALACALRVHSASNRPLHADEGVQAFTTAKLQESGLYDYTAEDRHGPTLYYFSVWLNKLRGIQPDGLSNFDLRLLPILFSLATLFLLGIAFPANWRATLIAASIVGVSPLCVIYGAYFVQEAIYVFLATAILVLGHRLLLKPTKATSVLLGVSIGLLQATKETSILIFGAVGISLFSQWIIKKKDRENQPSRKAPAWRGNPTYLLVLLPAVLTFILFQSSFFSDFGAIRESVVAYLNYFERAGGQGHQKPASYYLSLFFPAPSIGSPIGELPLLVFIAFGSFWSIWRSIKTSDPTVGFASGIAGLALALMYSLIPYKTPWLMYAPLTLLAISAAEGASHKIGMIAKSNVRAVATMTAILSLVAIELKPTLLATGRYATDERNPYIYSHTTGQYSKLQTRISELRNIRENLAIAIVSPDNGWPLPWDLRSYKKVGYWTQMPEPNQSFDLVLIDSRIKPSPQHEAALSETHVPDLHGLRPNTLITLFIEKELWDNFIAAR